MHPVIAKLDAERRRLLLVNPLFVALDPDVQHCLLDCVLDIREQLPRKDALDKLRKNRPREMMELKGALATIQGLLGREDVYEDIGYYSAAHPDCAHIDWDAVRKLLDAVGPVLELVEHYPLGEDDDGGDDDVGRQQRTRYPRWEVLNLEDLLRLFGMEVSFRTPDEVSNPSLELIGLLTDPPVSVHVALYRLRR